jgi:rubrerythrin
MSGRGETPEEDGGATPDVSLGTTLYTKDGETVGTVRGFEEGGVFVTTRDDIESLSIEHARTGHAFGEGELMWRCTTCGEMGEIDGGIPSECPGCGARKEELMYWTED